MDEKWRELYGSAGPKTLGSVTLSSGSSGVDVAGNIANVRRVRAQSVSYAGNRKT